MSCLACRGSTSDVSHVGELPGLQGYKGVALMWGYPGNVLAYDAVQTPDTDSSDKGPKTLQPSLIGYIAERTGGAVRQHCTICLGTKGICLWVKGAQGGGSGGGKVPACQDSVFGTCLRDRLGDVSRLAALTV